MLIVPAWVALTWLATGSVLVSAVSATLFILAVFVSVLLPVFALATREDAAATLRASRENLPVRPEPCSSVLTLPAHARANEVTAQCFPRRTTFLSCKAARSWGCYRSPSFCKHWPMSMATAWSPN